MKWLLDWKIGTKQVLAFGVVVVLTSFLGMFALVRLAAVRAATVDLSERRIPAIQSLSDLRAGLMQYRVSEMAYVFTAADDERESRAANMNSGMETVKKAEGAFEPLIDGAGEKNYMRRSNKTSPKPQPKRRRLWITSRTARTRMRRRR